MALSYAEMLFVLSWCCLSTVFGQLWCTQTEECAGEDLSEDMFYCWGMSSCAVSKLEGSLVDCAGFVGCYASDLSMSDDVFCESEDSCAFSSVTTTGGNVYCGGYYGCAGVSINCTDGIVECPGEAACRYGEIVKAGDGTYCFGDYGCWYTEISGSPVVYSWRYRSSYMGIFHRVVLIQCKYYLVDFMLPILHQYHVNRVQTVQFLVINQHLAMV